jgi:hypothetical protein
MKSILAAGTALLAVAAFATSASAQITTSGKKSGFGTTFTATQGSSGQAANTRNSSRSQGDTTVTVAGPRGQIKQGKTANTTTTTSGPGRNR